MKAEQQKLHPGVIALDERIRTVRCAVQVLESRNESESFKQEGAIEAKIAELREQLRTIRRHREEAAGNIVKRHDELRQLETLRDRCLSDDRIAQATWMQLILQRKPK